jgi:ketosteroid isomerase-like protein
MSLVDKKTFESKGARGCPDSTYSFAMTMCCERVGVVDDELQEFYWSSDTPSRVVSLLGDSDCPFCGASRWPLQRIDELAHVPEHWRWVCDNQPRQGRRQVRSLADHVEELVRFCQRIASPVPAFSTKLFLDTSDPHVRYDRRWIVEPGSLLTAAEFAPRFNEMLTAGYSWVNLSAHGVFREALIVGVELPRETTGVPVGLTAVNYSGPPNALNGAPDWDFNLVVTGQDISDDCESKIQSLVDRETDAWNRRDAGALVELFHPDMIWPWPPDNKSHDPATWEFSQGRFDAQRWRASWQQLFDTHELVHNRRQTVRVCVSAERDAGFAVVDVDTLWRNKADGALMHWKGRACKGYTKVGDKWLLIFHTGLLEH